MTSSKKQSKMPKTNHLGTEISKCSDEGFKLALVKKHNKFKRTREIKTVIEGTNSRIDQTEEIICEL